MNERSRINPRRWLVALALVAFSLGAHAAKIAIATSPAAMAANEARIAANSGVYMKTVDGTFSKLPAAPLAGGGSVIGNTGVGIAVDQTGGLVAKAAAYIPGGGGQVASIVTPIASSVATGILADFAIAAAPTLVPALVATGAAVGILKFIYDIGMSIKDGKVMKKPDPYGGCDWGPSYRDGGNWGPSDDPLANMVGSYNISDYARAHFSAAWRVDTSGTTCVLINDQNNGNGPVSRGVREVAKKANTTPAQPAVKSDITQAIDDYKARQPNGGYPADSAAPDALRDAVTAGMPIPVPDAPTVSVPDPASAPQGTISTVTNPDGSQQTQKQRVTCTTLGTELSCITTTTIETIPGPSATLSTPTIQTVTAPTPAPDKGSQSQLCDLFPGVLACTELGNTPDTQPLPKQTADVSFTPVVFQSNAQCPDPARAEYTILGRSYSVSFGYTSLCGILSSLVRPLMLLAAAVLAVFIFTDGLTV